MPVTVRVGGKDYVAGLHWELVEVDRLGAVRARLKKDLGSKGIVCHRRHRESISLGWADTGGENIAGNSLALAIADCHAEPWMGIFELREGLWWYIAISKEKEIVSSSDKVGTRAEVERLMSENQGLGEWSEVLEGASEDLESRLEDARKQDTKLHRVRRLQGDARRRAIVVAAGVFMLGGAVAGWQWYSHRAQAERERERMIREKESAAARLKAMPLPWSIPPDGGELIGQCRKTVSHLMLDVKGWKPAEATCSSSGATVVWKRDDFGNAADAPGVLSTTGDGSSSFHPWSLQHAGGKAHDAKPYATIQRGMYAIAQKDFVGFRQAGAVPFGARPGAGADAKALEPLYVKHVYVLQVKGMWQIAPFLRIPTARIESIRIVGLADERRTTVSLAVWSKP